VVGLVGGLGGFVLPIAFGALNDLTGVWQSCFWLLFAIVSLAMIWMHLAIRRMEMRAARKGVHIDKLPELPEMEPLHSAATLGRTTSAPHGFDTGVAVR
jgi:NNP family nitrate/nitrite transporter-like MFS transporter